uniref:Uncharacterized protein n=1 Tax=viral metagenome TaxID=1070528 RepID=A0A6M3J2W8_9ZZZZ
MAKKKSPPPRQAPLFIRNTLHPVWANFFEQFLPMAETQTDASAAAGDPPTKAEFDALVGKFNDLIDKLQAANLME